MTRARDDKYGMTFDRVDSVLAYDAETGIFRWKVKVSDRAPVGKIAGCHSVRGHWRIKIDGHYYFAHRLAWFLVTGAWPDGQIDHKNRVRDDNRFNNLRAASPSQNHANSKLYKNNTTGFKGVQFSKAKNKYQATVVESGKRYHVGFFVSAEEAHAAYCRRAAELHGEFHHTGSTA